MLIGITDISATTPMNQYKENILTSINNQKEEASALLQDVVDQIEPLMDQLQERIEALEAGSNFVYPDRSLSFSL